MAKKYKTKRLYSDEILASEDDDGTMVNSKKALEEAVVGHKIVDVTTETVKGRWYGTSKATVITLDNGKRVEMVGESDCCAYTEVEEFLLNADKVDHIITGVGTTDGYDTWHIYADMGDVLKLKVAWSCGNPFYYGYGFIISVKDID
jgi:hypothetical protein